ncbi:hypothetical protein HYH03_004748 [Edaphochlamys debaryana]|uniref:Uncharacterized protein n=1 Tax=Edaphochlamys debaryana TaxID=47281 RepID=A0A836C2W7_9CHLO|nr:hypothetical protein HYH03_004748 [Edaphochlamys debaryana]|eukprot:KAG2497158.1 hypothetical protein HYH03_004748 [Edaphochlamys debaryana]
MTGAVVALATPGLQGGDCSMTVIVRRLAAVDLSRQLVRVDGGSEVHPLAAVLPGPPTAQQWREACRELAGRLLRGEAEHVTAAQLRSVCERLAVLQRCAAELPAPGQPVDAARRKALEAVLSAPVMDEPTWELWRGELQKWRWDAERAAQLAATGGPVEPWPEPVSVPVGGAVEPQLEGAAGPQPSTLQPTAPRTEPEAVHGACVSPLKTAADEASAPRSGRRGRSRERSTEERRRGDFSEAAERHRGSEGRALGRKSTPRGRSPSPGPRAGTREAGRGSGGGWGRGSAPRGEGRPEERWPTVGAWAAEVHTYLLRQPGHSAEAAHLMKVGLGVPAAFLPKGKSVSGFLHWFDSLWTVADKRESRALTLTAVPGRPSGSDLADPRALPSGRAGRR